MVAAEPNNLLGIITKPRPEEMDEWTHFDYDAGGNVVWRNTQVAAKHIGQLIYNDGYLALFGPGGIGAGKNPFTGCIRVSDAKLLWTGTFPTTWNRAGYVMLWRDGRIYYADPWKIFTLDPETGRETHVYGGS